MQTRKQLQCLHLKAKPTTCFPSIFHIIVHVYLSQTLGNVFAYLHKSAKTVQTSKQVGGNKYLNWN